MGEASTIANTRGIRTDVLTALKALHIPVLRWPGDLYATVTQTLTGFEHHHVMEITGTEGSLRTWWSGAMDRTAEPAFEPEVQRRGETSPSLISDLGQSGEKIQLREELRQLVKDDPDAAA